MPISEPKLLVIDDEPGVNSFCQLYFSRTGYTVYTAENGKEGLALAKKINPDLVILDRVMPDMDGNDVLKTLRTFNKDAKVIIFTGHRLNSEKEQSDYRALGISAYIQKPASIPQLAETVKKILRGEDLAGQNELEISHPASPSLASIEHQMKNILGNIRSECEVYLLNKADGLYQKKSPQELETMADAIMNNVIAGIDRAIKVFLNK